MKSFFIGILEAGGINLDIYANILDICDESEGTEEELKKNEQKA